MGGVLIGIAILLPTVLWSDPANHSSGLLLFPRWPLAPSACRRLHQGVQRRSLGLTARAKLFYQGLAGTAVAIALCVLQQFNLFPPS